MELNLSDGALSGWGLHYIDRSNDLRRLARGVEPRDLSARLTATDAAGKRPPSIVCRFGFRGKVRVAPRPSPTVYAAGTPDETLTFGTRGAEIASHDGRVEADLKKWTVHRDREQYAPNFDGR